MPILLIFGLVAACLPVTWPEPLLGGGLETAATFTITATTLSLCAAFALRTWVVRTLRRSPGRKVEVAQIYSRLRRGFFFTNLGMVATCVLVFGWGWLTQQMFIVERNGGPLLAPFAELAVPLPYFVILLGAWLIYYDAERTLHCTTVLGPNNKDYWSRIGYFFNHLRQFAFVMVPVLPIVAQQTASRFFPETWRSDWYLFGLLFALPLIFLLPLLIKPLLGLKPMPAGPARDRLEAMAKRLHFHYADILLWHTHGAVANAMIFGLLPGIRYVIFTDRIIEELLPDELDAVFGHEVGHAKHGHIWLYMTFLLLSTTTLTAGLLLIGQQLDAANVELPKWAEGWIALPPFIIIVSYIFVVFGFLSRRCERQADVYGCRAVSCTDTNCLGHDSATIYPERAQGLCPTGIRTFIGALQRVDMINGGIGFEEDRPRTIGTVITGIFKWLKAWQHSTMSLRMAFLGSLIGNPQKEQRFQKHITMLRWGLLLGLAATLFGLGQAVGWEELLHSM